MSTARQAPPLTAIVMTHNEAHQIAECVRALLFAERVLVVDSGSTDGTRDAAVAAGADVDDHPFTDFASQRNHGLARVTSEWTLMIDADERVSPELADEITAAVTAVDAGVAGFRLLRRNHFMGRPLDRYAGGRERIVRLVRTRRAHWVNAVHEAAQVDGTVGDLEQPLEHLTHLRLQDAFEKALRYATLWAADMHGRGRRTSLLGIAGHTAHRFVKVLVLKHGFLEGMRGFLLAGSESVGVFFKYALLWERTHRPAKDP